MTSPPVGTERNRKKKSKPEVVVVGRNPWLPLLARPPIRYALPLLCMRRSISNFSSLLFFPLFLTTQSRFLSRRSGGPRRRWRSSPQRPTRRSFPCSQLHSPWRRHLPWLTFSCRAWPTFHSTNGRWIHDGPRESYHAAARTHLVPRCGPAPSWQHQCLERKSNRLDVATPPFAPYVYD